MATGTFDLVHAGHVIFFEDCKKYGDMLVVVLGEDKLLKKYKGSKRPIFNQHIRLKMIDSLKPVDYTTLDTLSQESGHLLQVLELSFASLKPDFYVINEDAFNIEHRKELCKKFGVELIILKRHCPEEFENISTTGIIEKVQGLK